MFGKKKKIEPKSKAEAKEDIVFDDNTPEPVEQIKEELDEDMSQEALTKQLDDINRKLAVIEERKRQKAAQMAQMNAASRVQPTIPPQPPHANVPAEIEEALAGYNQMVQGLNIGADPKTAVLFALLVEVIKLRRTIGESIESA